MGTIRRLLLVWMSWAWAMTAAGSPPTNLLLITVDDMSADSVGVFGAPMAGTTPQLDALAAQGMRFEMAHVQVANCMPSRNVMWSGRYPHSNGVEGFAGLPEVDYPTLGELLNEAGYLTAIRQKVRDSTPYRPYPWGLVLDSLPEIARSGRKDPLSYGAATALAIQAARLAGKPFAVMINIADPHVPFYGVDKQGNPVEDPHTPSRVFRPGEVAVPGFLPDDAVVRAELAHYYASVRRADDAVGAVLRALEDSGEAPRTLVVFLSDHGMPLPFAKTQLYHHSTRTPLIVRWPGVVEPGSVDAQHMVSAVDLLPTLLEAVGESLPPGLQGRSFLPLLRGEGQQGRTRVFKAYNENSSGQRRPMRAVQSPRFLYIFNPWSDGRRSQGSATAATHTWRRMGELAQRDPAIGQRVQLLLHRVPEELYDLSADPDCLDNRIDDPALKGELDRLRSDLAEWMAETGDTALGVFLARDDPQARAQYMHEQAMIERERLARVREKRKAPPGDRPPRPERAGDSADAATAAPPQPPERDPG